MSKTRDKFIKGGNKMSYSLLLHCGTETKVYGLGLTLREAYNLLKKVMKKEDDETLETTFENLQYAIEQYNGHAWLYRSFWEWEIKEE